MHEETKNTVRKEEAIDMGYITVMKDVHTCTGYQFLAGRNQGRDIVYRIAQ